MRLQDLLGVFYLRTTLVVQLSMKLCGLKEIRREETKRLNKLTQTYDVKNHDDDDDDDDEWSHNENQS